MTMTSQQNTRWQRAVKQLDYLDFHCCSKEGLEAFGKRLRADRGAPAWAIQTRSDCIAQGIQERHPQVYDFALRSEVALLGLKILYPEKEERIHLYRRLLPDFLNRVLASLAEDYSVLQELRQLLSAPEQDEQLLLEQSKFLGDMRFGMSLRATFGEQPPDPAQQYVLRVAGDCTDLVRLAHFAPPLKWWGVGGLKLGTELIWCYDERIKFGGFSGSRLETLQELGTYRPVADAFLSVLESECPPPDWLHREA